MVTNFDDILSLCNTISRAFLYLVYGILEIEQIQIRNITFFY